MIIRVADAKACVFFNNIRVGAVASLNFTTSLLVYRDYGQHNQLVVNHAKIAERTYCALHTRC